MISLRVWRALNSPPGVHPLFQRTVLLPANVPRHYFTLANSTVNFVLGIGHHAPTLLLLFMPPILSLIGIGYGLECALRISTAIARGVEDNTYSLLALTPGGPINASWVISASALYRNRDFDRLRTTIYGTLIFSLALAPLYTLFSLVFSVDINGHFMSSADVFANFVNFLTTLAVVYLEYIQSTVQGVLVGILIPSYVNNRLDANLYALGSFLLLQFAAYSAFILAGFGILNALIDRLPVHEGAALILLALLRIVTFFAIREVILNGLWRLVATRLNTSLDEFIHLTRPIRY